jgi:hypothetical protein
LSRVEYSRKRRELKKQIAKAVRERKKRSHLKKELATLNADWFKNTGGLSRRIFRLRVLRKLSQALSSDNPILERLRNKDNND